jgi:hypothetical protein
MVINIVGVYALNPNVKSQNYVNLKDLIVLIKNTN